MELTAKGVRVHYEQMGERGKNVLLLHGWGCSIQHFQPIAQDLSRDYRVTVIDFPAHGASGRPPEPWGVPEFAECTKDLIEQLGIAPCDIIAHSFGGRVALWLAANDSQLVSRLVLTGSAGLRKEPTPEQKKRSEEYKKKKEALLGLTKLPLVGAEGETPLTGYDTQTAIRSGALQGIACEVDGYILRLRQAYPELEVLITGGDGPKIAVLSSEAGTGGYDEWLVARGLNAILNYNEQLQKHEKE